MPDRSRNSLAVAAVFLFLGALAGFNTFEPLMIHLPDTSKYGGMMYFHTLDALQRVQGVYTLCWRFKDSWTDPWTLRVNAFKSGNTQAVRGASRICVDAVGSLDWNAFQPVGIATAISSGETCARPGQPLYVLGEHLAGALGWKWVPDLLSKKPHRSLHSIPNASERDQTVDGAYAATSVRGLKTIVLLDDFCTRGATLSDAARAILEVERNITIFGLALGKAETLAFADQQGVTLNNDHVPGDWADRWDHA